MIHALNKQLYAILQGSLENFKLFLEETQVTDGSIQEFCQIMNKYRHPEKPFQSFEVKLNKTIVKEETIRLVQETQIKLLKHESEIILRESSPM